MTTPTAIPRLILLDRDGTLIVEKDYLDNPDEVELIPGVAMALKMLKERGHFLALVSNQSGVARGYFGAEAVEQIHNRIQELLHEEAGVELDALYFCPHGPEDGCECRKPNSGMLLQAAEDSGLTLYRAVMIGDKLADIEAGGRVGTATILVRTGYGKTTEAEYPQLATSVVDDLPAAANLILEME